MLLIDNVKKALEEITQGNWKLGDGCIYVKPAYGVVTPVCVRPNNDNDAHLITKAPIYLKAFLELVESLVADAEKEGNEHIKQCVEYEKKIAELEDMAQKSLEVHASSSATFINSAIEAEEKLKYARRVLKWYGHDPYLESVGYTKQALDFLERVKPSNDGPFNYESNLCRNDVVSDQ